MPGVTAQRLLERNRRHCDGLPEGYFDAHREGQRPPLVSVCCADSRVPAEGMWAVDRPGWLFAPRNIGNVVWSGTTGDREVDGSVLYPVAVTDTETVAVVGHTGCGAITAEYERVVADDPGELPQAIAHRVDLLEPVVESAIDAGVVPGELPADGSPDPLTISRLVEFNVLEQVRFLRTHDAVDETVNVLGFVYDIHGHYGDRPGRTALVAINEYTDPAEIRERLDPAVHDAVVRLNTPGV